MAKRFNGARIPPHLVLRAGPKSRMSAGAHQRLASLATASGLDEARLVDLAVRVVTVEQLLAQHAEDVQDVSAWQSR